LGRRGLTGGAGGTQNLRTKTRSLRVPRFCSELSPYKSARRGPQGDEEKLTESKGGEGEETVNQGSKVGLKVRRVWEGAV